MVVVDDQNVGHVVPQADGHGEPATGGVGWADGAVHRFGEAVGDGQAEPQAAVAGVVALALERGKHVLLLVGGYAGAVIDHCQPRRPASACARMRVGCPVGLTRTALATRLAMTRSSRPGSASARGRSAGTSTRRVLWRASGSARWRRLRRGGWASVDADRTCLQAAHREQVLDQIGHRSVDSSMVSTVRRARRR